MPKESKQITLDELVTLSAETFSQGIQLLVLGTDPNLEHEQEIRETLFRGVNEIVERLYAKNYDQATHVGVTTRN